MMPTAAPPSGGSNRAAENGAFGPALETFALAYAKSREAQDRARLCEAALPLVRRLAVAVMRRLPPHFAIEDLISDGCLGLLRAADRFDPAHAVCFEMWASRLVRGAILNGLRRMDAIPERVRRDARNLDGARWRLAQRDFNAPSDAAAAESFGMSEQKLQTVLLALRRAAMLSLDAPLQTAEDGAVIGDRIAADCENPVDAVVEKSVHCAVASAVAALGPRERKIIASFYAGGATFRQIGNHLGISKQRVSQLHGRALSSLRATLAAQLQA